MKKNYAREKSEKTLKKCAWKSLFARENFRQITPVKAKLTGVKNIENYSRETGKSAREKLWAEICAKIDMFAVVWFFDFDISVSPELHFLSPSEMLTFMDPGGFL